MRNQTRTSALRYPPWRGSDVLKLLCVCVLALATTGVANAGTGASIRVFLEGLDAGDVAEIAGRGLRNPELITTLYRSRENEPLWMAQHAPTNPQIDGLLVEIEESAGHGFNPDHYHHEAIKRLMASNASTLALELLLTDAFLSQAAHRGQGIVSPPNLDSDWQLPVAEVDVLQLLMSVAQGERSVSEALDSLWPRSEEYFRLVQRRAEIAASQQEHSVQIGPGKLLRPNESDDRVVLLKERLLGPGEYDTLYDQQLRQAVVAFQRVSGLEPDGLVGSNTLELLNETRVSWLERIDANLERWRWLPRTTPETYVRVNIAAFHLRAIEASETTLAMNVVVGRPYRRTPVFTETIKYFVVNPSWNVPFSIATKDKLPLLQKDAAAEAAKGFEAKRHGSDDFVSVDTIDWQGVKRSTFNFLLRQKAGPANALGQIKFMLPNPYAVYLHDTPSRELFAKQERSFSSGCVRVAEPFALMDWLLRVDGQTIAESLYQSVEANETRTVYLKTPVPTYIVYFTAFVDDADQVVFRRDIYGRDKILVSALRGELSEDS